MVKTPLQSVKVLTLSEIAEMWTQEEEELNGVLVSVIARELNIADQ